MRRVYPGWGFLFAQAFLLFRSLWLPFGLHAGWHLAMRLLGSVGLNSDEAVFMITKVEGPAMLVSTKAGGAGLFELIGVLLVSGILFLIRIGILLLFCLFQQSFHVSIPEF